MNQILIYIKKLIPKKLFKKITPFYHYLVNFLASVFYGFPSNKLIVVGVTGTTGKTTVIYMLAQMLKSAGVKVGYTSTSMFADGKKEWLNGKKMTMLDGFFTQKMLAKMVKNECKVAIVETTSEGVVHYRHRFINYDFLIFTGIYPEHIESHGSFENYKLAKIKLFNYLQNCKKKNLPLLNSNLLDLKKKKIKKTFIIDGDDKYAQEFLNQWAERKVIFKDKNREERKLEDFNSKINYSFLEMNETGIKFNLDDWLIQMKILGKFNAKNSTIAGIIGLELGLNKEEIKNGLEKITGIPGRMEQIRAGQNFQIIVDYAFEPVAVGELYETIKVLHSRKIIHVLGSCGGGRDVSRREKLGRIVGEKADFVIVTNEDPYDDDPMEIIQAVAKGAKRFDKVENKNLFLIEDRREAIKKALNLAQENDLVLITGKGSEQAIVVKDGKKIDWDDRKVVLEVLTERN